MYKVALIAGGDSGEYEVSLKTGDNIFNQLDKELFEPYLIHFKGSDWHYKANDGRIFQIDKNIFLSLFSKNGPIYIYISCYHYYIHFLCF